jgi:hypothetical protein
MATSATVTDDRQAPCAKGLCGHSQQVVLEHTRRGDHRLFYHFAREYILVCSARCNPKREVLFQRGRLPSH